MNKHLVSLAALALLSACPQKTAAPSDAGQPIQAPAAGAVDPADQMVAMKALFETVDNVLKALPAARDDAGRVVGELLAVRKTLGDAEVKRRMLPYVGKPMPSSPRTDIIFNTVVLYAERRKALHLEELAAQPRDAGPLAVMAQRLERQSTVLKQATVLLQEIDKAQFELDVLTGRSKPDGGAVPGVVAPAASGDAKK